MNELSDKCAIITGASSGIGAAVVRLLAAEGTDVVLAARSQQALDELASELEGPARTLAVATDVTKHTDVQALVERTIETFGRIDILINCAGVGLFGKVAELEEAALKEVFDVNVFGPLRTLQAVVPAMRQTGGGTIVNVNSTAGRVVRAQLSVASAAGGGYAASKFALYALTQAARFELAGEGIHLISVFPGRTLTPFGHHTIEGSQGYQRPQEPPAPDRWSVPPERVARRIVQAIRRGEAEAYVTWWDRLFVLLARWFPGLYRMAMRRRAERHQS